MRQLTRKEALGLCDNHAVVVEYGNRGLRVTRIFDSHSPFYPGIGPYDFRGVRYFLALESAEPAFSKGSVPRTRMFEKTEAETPVGLPSERIEDDPKIESEAPISITAKIFAEDGKSPPPKGIVAGGTLKLKAVPSHSMGAYSWRAATKALKIENQESQIVTLAFLPDQMESAGGEKVEMVFTPKGKPALPPQSHSIKVVKALFMKNDRHLWGYDEQGEIPAKDHNGMVFPFTPDSKLDLVSVQMGKVGLVDVHYAGADGNELFFEALDSSVCDCKPLDPASNPIELEIHAKTGKYKETKVQVRYGEKSGPVVAEIEVIAMANVQYKAKYFRVEDPDSPKTALKVPATPAIFEEALKRIFKPGAAEWKIEGEPVSVKSKYDILRNGALDIEPGTESEELSQIMSDCPYKGTRIVHVHALRWSYFLSDDAGPQDSVIKLKNYGRYLDFIGTNSYVLEDTSGKSARVKIISVDMAKAELKLSAPLGIELKTSRRAALLWPLGGLSGDPTLVSDSGGLPTLIGVVAHELGHTNAGLKDISEIKNIMHGVAEGNEGLRGRSLPLFYHPERMEKQWAKIAGRA